MNAPKIDASAYLSMPDNAALQAQAARIGSPLITDYGRSLPTLSAFRTVVGRVRDKVDQLLTQPNQYSTSTATRAQSQLGTQWRTTVVPVLDQFEPTFAALAGVLREILLDDTRNAGFQSTATATTTSTAVTKLHELGNQLGAAVDALLAKSDTLALPQRPTPADAAQEARLAGLKSDLVLVTGSLDTSAANAWQLFLDRLAAQLTSAMADSDALATWLIASRWTTDTLAMALFGSDLAALKAIASSWPSVLAGVLADGSPEVADAVRLHTALAAPSDGLPALTVACGGFTAQVAADVRDYVAGLVRTGRVL